MSGAGTEACESERGVFFPKENSARSSIVRFLFLKRKQMETIHLFREFIQAKNHKHIQHRFRISYRLLFKKMFSNEISSGSAWFSFEKKHLAPGLARVGTGSGYTSEQK
jgi:hypothetical protein